MDVRRTAQRARELAEPAYPYAVQAAASAAAFTVGLAATQLGCFALRLSSATPVLASAVGALGVGLSSALAGQASLRARAGPARHAGDAPPRYWRRQDVLLDAAVGVALFKAMGGRYRSLLPSDITKVGACAVESIPAPGSAYAQGTSKGELVRLMRRDGCHHCGTRRGRVVGDHMPPNKVAGTSGPPRAAPGFSSTAIGALMPRPRGRPPKPPPPDAAADSALAAARALWQAGETVARGAGLTLGRRRSQPLVHRARTLFARARASALWRIKDSLGLTPPRQRYYPQCRACSYKQAAAVRTGRMTLQLHNGGSRPWFYAGVMAGLRHYAEPARPAGGRGGLAAGAGFDESVLDDLLAAVRRMQDGHGPGRH